MCVCVCVWMFRDIELKKLALAIGGFRLTLVFSQMIAVLNCQQYDTVGAESFVCELTVVVTISMEKKYTVVGPKTYSEKRVKCH